MSENTPGKAITNEELHAEVKSLKEANFMLHEKIDEQETRFDLNERAYRASLLNQSQTDEKLSVSISQNKTMLDLNKATNNELRATQIKFEKLETKADQQLNATEDKLEKVEQSNTKIQEQLAEQK